MCVYGAVPPREEVSAHVAEDSPRTSPSALLALPRIPCQHLQLLLSLEEVEVLSSWGALVGAQGLLPSPRFQHCTVGYRKRSEGPRVIYSGQLTGPTPMPKSRCSRDTG